MTKPERFQEITEDMSNLYCNKNADYGDSFGQSINEFGPIAGLVRISDKFNRAKSLLSGNQPKVNESVIDTLTDLACYAIMLRIELEQQ